MTQSSGRLGVGIVGMGKAGPVIGSALRAVGHQIVGVTAHSAEAIERADTFLPSVPVLSIEELIERCELVILAVPDSEISSVVSGLARLKAWKMGQVLVHMAGPYGTQILQPATDLGVIPLAIHPLLRLSGWSSDVQRLTGAPFLVTAPAPFLPIAQALVVEMGGEPVCVAEDSRAAVHAALTLGVVGIVSSIAQALRALDTAALSEAHLVASRLFTDAAAAAIDEGAAAFGAPLVNADADCVREHVLALGRLDPRAHDAYVHRAKAAIDLLAENGRIDQRHADARPTALYES